MALTTTQKTEAYQFFIVAFGAATGVEYMNQLNDAYNAGMTTKQIVNVYTTKPQFEALYPRFDTNEQFAERLIENVVGASATAAAKTEAKADVAAALNAGWTKGDVVFQIFTNLAAKAPTDAQWGNTSLMLANKVAVAQYITETLLVNTTDLAKLGSYIASVTEVAATVDAAKLAAQGANGQTFTLTASAVSVEEGGNATFALTLDSAPTSDVTVNYVTATGTAGSSDYTSVSGTVTFAAGQTSQFVTIATTEDSAFEADETFTVTFSGSSLTASVTATGTITNDDVDPSTQVQTYTLTASAPAVSEGNAGLKTITFELTLDRAPTQDVTVQVQTLAGTATSDEDYTPVATNVTFSAGQRVAVVSVNVVGDTTFEANETLTLRVTGALLAAPVIATGTISNDDLNPEQAQLDAYAAAALVTAAAASAANAAVADAQADAAATAAAATVTSLSDAEAYAAATETAAASAADAADAAAAQLAAAQAQLAAAVATSGTADNVEAQAAVTAAQANVVAATAAVDAAAEAATLSAAAVVDYTALTVNMNAAGTAQVLSGSMADDVFEAAAGEINGDTINGRGGNDTLLISAQQTDTDPDRVVVLTSVETIKVDGADPASNFAVVLNVTGSTGVNTLNVVDTASATITGAASLLNLDLASSTTTARTQTVGVTYAAAVVEGTSTTQAISLNNVNATVNISGIEALNITATGANNSLAGSVGSSTAITVTGAGSVNLGSVDNAATVINASALGGGVTVTAGVASSITGGQGVDNITGSAGNDTIYGGTGNDVIVANGGNDTVYGDDGDDNINATSGNNVIFGGLGADTITLGTGFDAVNAGDGNDWIIAAGNLDGLDLVNGGAGFDTLVVNSLSSDVFLQSVSGVEQLEFTSVLDTNNYKLLLAPSAGVTHFVSTSTTNNDVFDATAGGFTTGLTFEMGGGNDSLKGGSGNDVFVFEQNGLTGADSIDGGTGSNSLHLDNSASAITGAAVNLNNLSNVSTINVGTAAGSSAATAQNIALTITGTETTAQVITVSASVMQDGNDAMTLTASGANANTDFVVVGGAADDGITTGAGDDTISGGDGNDNIHADSGANSVDGGNGEDTITVSAASTVDGGAGRDEIKGSTGADVLRGGAGSDIIYANGGDDVLTGGADSDIFVVNSNAPTDEVTITDFNTAQDRIVIEEISGQTVSYVGSASNFANAQASISATGAVEAVFQSDINTLWIDSNNDGTLNANDTRIVLQGVTSLATANVSSVLNASLPTLDNTLLSIDAAKALYNTLPNAVYIVFDSASDIIAALTVGAPAPNETQLAARTLTTATLAQALQVRFDGPVTPQQLLDVRDVTSAEIVYTSISAASPADLALLAGTEFADATMPVTLTAPVSLQQAAAVDAAWGTLTLTSISDSASAFAAADGTETDLSAAYLVSNVNVTVTGTSTMAQLATINAGNGSGTLTYTSITDAASTLVTNAGSYVTGSVAVTVVGTASLSQLATIDGNTTGTVTHTSVTDLADNFANDAGTLTSNGSAYVNSGTSVTVTDAATLAQLAALDAENGSGTLTYTHVIGTAANYASTAGVLTANATTYVTPGKNVHITDAATLAQLVIVDTANGTEVDGDDEGSALDWTFTYTGVTDTAANIASSAGVLTSAAQTYVTGSQTVNFNTTVNVAQINAVDAATTGLVSYGTVQDTAAALSSTAGLAVLNGATTGVSTDITNENHHVVIEGDATAAQFIAIQAANNSGTVSVGRILASTGIDSVDLTTHQMAASGDQTVVYTNGLQAATAVFANVSDSTQLQTSDTFTLANVDVLTLNGADKIDLSAFNLSGQALVTDLTVNGTTIRDGSWMLVDGTYASGTFTTGGTATHTLLLWDGNQSGGVGAVNMQGVVIVGSTFESSDLILLA